jgi:hypothetical protein
MTQTVTGPDGKKHTFPDEATPEQLQAAMEQFYAPKATNAGFLNQAISRGLGGPVDLANAALGVVGLGSEEPFGGSKLIGKGLAKLGVDVAPEGAKPDSIGGYVARGVGETAGALLPGGAIAKGAAALPGMAGRVAQSINQTWARKPITSLAGEVAAGAGAGAGGGIANQIAPGSLPAEVLGELAGGVGAGAAGIAAKATPTVTGLRLAKKAIVPFTRSGAMPRAERRAQELAADPATAGKRLEQPTISSLTPAQRSGEKKLMSAERYIADQDPAFAEKLTKQQEKATGQLKGALQEVGGGASLEDTHRVIGPQAFKNARAEERKLWARVPMDVQVPTEKTYKAFERVLVETPRAQMDDIPDAAKRLLSRDSNDGFGKIETVQEIQGLRSKLLEEARAARKAGHPNKARIADNLAEALLADLDAAPGSAELREALDFSRGLNTKFTRTNKATLTNPTGKSYTRQFIDAPDIETIVKSRNPKEFAATLRDDALAEDTSGRAFRGLQAGAVDYLIKKSSFGVDLDTGDAVLSGARMRKLMGEPSVKAALSELLPPEKMARLNQIIDELSVLDRSRSRLPDIGGKLINDTPSSLLSLMVRTVAARQGAKWGQGTSGASLLTAGFFSKRAQQMLQNLTADKAEALITEAITSDNPALLQALLTNTTVKIGRKIAAQRLNAWLAQPAFSYLDETKEQER